LYVYRTDDRAHPGVARLFQRGELYVGGEVEVLPEARSALNQNGRYRSPRELRKYFGDRDWNKVVAFQTRNPIHRAHEYIQKCALETVDGLLIHPLVGHTKSDDIPPDVRLRSYDALLANYYPPDRTVLSVFPAAMRYAGPREAVFHAIARKNYGCTHFIVGRDHAGVGSYYGAFDAQKIFDEIPAGSLKIEIFRGDHTAWSRKLNRVVMFRDAPDHQPEDYINLSGTKVREMLVAGQPLPAEFARPEVAEILMKYYQEEAAKGQ
jgi:ATP sulfurylase